MTLDLELVALGDVDDDHRIVFSLYDGEPDIHAHNIAGEFSGIASMPAPRPPDNDLSGLHVGIASKPTTISETIFVDEVAAHTSRIGCL